jgi:hypothetical protein
MYIVNYFSVWPEIVFVEVCMVKKTVMVGMYPPRVLSKDTK